MSGAERTGVNLPQDDAVLDLLAERATSGLDAQREEELAAMLRSYHGVDREALDEIAAALSVVFAAAEGEQELPESLDRSLRAAAAVYAAPQPESASMRFPGLRAEHTESEQARDELRREGRIPLVAWGGWLAAAAAVLFALVVTAPQRQLSPQEQMSQLVETAGDAWTSQWASLPGLGLASDPHPRDNGVEGRLVWSDSRNEGYMEISGLEPNNPEQSQYQLWIFDETRPRGQYPGVPDDNILSQRPVDGGVFNFTPGPDGKAIVPVNAKLRVGEGVIFAVTVEPPGGVVVSDRDIVFGAAAPTG